MTIEIRPVTVQYDRDIRQIIEQVGKEFGAFGEGFGPSDPEVQAMSQHYLPQQGALYLVALKDDKVIGGCGVAPFSKEKNVCELKKLFLLPESRGLGAGKQLTIECLAFAQQFGYAACYLDTLSNMTTAIHMYEGFGFEYLDKPMEETLHGKCDVWMLKKL
ncbi:GNAT family N-acetyltransferase [Vibrio sonorensis]|uniref:GNAT family N-acetyltransferase n=1 Tax=Vibrio sonorensis TaxID=1004316 RepID=UPI0008D93EDB|nr:GNAT family N-acetyltransferase [Vibrio sonorensis]